jgi:hypothetical protein
MVIDLAAFLLLTERESGHFFARMIRARGENFFSDVRHAADERRIELRHKLEEMRASREG